MKSRPVRLAPLLARLAERFEVPAERSGRVDLAVRRVRAIESRSLAVYRNIETGLSTGRQARRWEEWLLDNRHVLEGLFESLEANLPNRFVSKLPRVSMAHGGGAMLHADALARALLDTGALPIEPVWIADQLSAYQHHAELLIGELWALPGMLAINLLEDLMDVVTGCGELVEPEPAGEGGEDPLSSTVAGIIISLRTVDSYNWHGFFESVSRVERILLDDPAGAYAGMEFESRNRYRSVVESLARGSGKSEAEVAAEAVKLAREGEPGDPRTGHVGHFLISGGRRRLESMLGYRAPPADWLPRFADRRPGLVYFGFLSVFTLLASATVLQLIGLSRPEWPGLIVVLALILIPAIGVAIVLLNGLLAWLLPPRALARMDYESGIPAAWRSAVVVPVLLVDEHDIDAVFDCLETNFVGNRDPELVYAVLGDLADAPAQNMAGDDHLLEHARRRLRELSERHREASFLFLCRERQFNPAENCWMGWERKRGKLMEFNRLLAGNHDTSYATIEGPRAAFEGVRFVITLDADTRMPPGIACRLVGTLAHPLSRAVFDRDHGTLKAGYTIIQPRLEIDPGSTLRSAFTDVFSGDHGLDLYSHVASDVYHDLFGEGNFTGKGIYDWQALDHTLAGRIPDNTLLSHDLFEGIHGRVGLASDLVLLEQFPPTLQTFMRRMHRWVRGDWQLLPWLGRSVPRSDGSRMPNSLPWAHRWKIIDNLRRSLMPPVLLLILALAWLSLLPGNTLAWTLLVAAFIAAPLLADLLGVLTRALARPSVSALLLVNSWSGLKRQFLHALVSLVLLPYQAAVLIDAIGRTLVRLFLTHRALLEWVTAAHAHRQQGRQSGLFAAYRRMWTAPATALALALAVGTFNPSALPMCIPVLLAWFAAPGIAWQLDRAAAHRQPDPDADTRRYLRKAARRTWLFFEHMSVPDNHWLPPDNLQLDPRSVIARRTSPTNIGMGLNATLAAHDFGWIDIQELSARLHNTMDRMASLERYRGHWLNWYETEDLHPLHPRYVSTVDSGNLAAALIVTATGLNRLADQPLRPVDQLHGLADTLNLVEDLLTGLPGADGRERAVAPLVEHVAGLSETLYAAPASDTVRLTRQLCDRDIPDLTGRMLALAGDPSVDFSKESLHELRVWFNELDSQARRLRRHIESFMPWLALLDGLDKTTFEQPEAGAAKVELLAILQDEWSLTAAPASREAALARLDLLAGAVPDPGAEGQAYETLVRDLPGLLDAAVTEAARTRQALLELAARAGRWVEEMDFGFLYDASRHLFHIGYDLSNGSLDSNHYDLLASEARLASLIAISRGQVPIRHWRYLGRPFRRRRGRGVLMSWGATMFEYLMPSLYARSPDGSLLDRACHEAIVQHRAFSERYEVPWGISESGYYQLGEQREYQYRSFGVPFLGFRRDLGDRLVIAPYASAMALPWVPEPAVANLRELESVRGSGLYGFHEAVDFGRSQRSAPHRPRVVRSWMSHHQGMILLAIDNHLNGNPMVERFHADRHIAGVEMLLHERMPRRPPRLKASRQPRSGPAVRVAPRPDTWAVESGSARAQYTLLGNGHYGILLDARGTSRSFWDDVALTRWQPDRVGINGGQRMFISDLDKQQSFRVGSLAAGRDEEAGQVSFGPHRAEWRERAMGLLIRQQVAVASQHDIEARRVIIANETARERRIFILDHAEVVLAPVGDFERHPAFSRLFIESECLAEERLLLFRRRARDATDRAIYMAHGLVTPPDADWSFGWETDRSAALGRDGDPAHWPALEHGVSALSGRSGAVLDPVMALGVEIRLPAYGQVELAFMTGVSRSRRELLANMRQYRTPGRIEWLFEQARMQTSHELKVIGVEAGEASGIMRLLSAMAAPEPDWRSVEGVLPSEALQLLLFARGISGDWPLVVVWIRDDREPEQVEFLLKAHTLLAARQWRFDLVLVDEAAGGYGQPTRDALQTRVDEVRSRIYRSLAGSVTIVSGRELSAEHRLGLARAASIVLEAGSGSVAAQLHSDLPEALPEFIASRESAWKPLALTPRVEQVFFNGLGGFDQKQHEYVIEPDDGRTTPAPWCNVLANADFGTLLGASGSACTWCGNSSESRLTPWLNDPVSEPSGEVLYLRDEETGEVWTPSRQPCPGDGPYRVRHGLGYSIFEHASHELEQTMRVHIDATEPVKLVELALTNRSAWTRRVTATYYLEWVLGTHRMDQAHHLRCEVDPGRSAVLAHNPFSPRWGQARAFVAASKPLHGFTTCRREFLGANGSTLEPAALRRIGLSSRARPGADPCAALQVHLDLAAGETVEIGFVIGQGRDRAHARSLIEAFTGRERIATSREGAVSALRDRFDRVQVSTPEPAMDLMLNDWLPYQALNGRLLGRTGYYQSSGAFGFRDQLQDMLAMIWFDPAMVRSHLLLAASRQFEQGDVLHWWHEDPLRGVRTRCSDDLLWLPFAVAHYVATTGDHGVLDEPVVYLSGPELASSEQERYAEFSPGERSGSLYEHCVRAIDRSMTVGVHGLPTIGSGDWNDGFNRVGSAGRGESVWLAWFLVRVLNDFAECCLKQGDTDCAGQYQRYSARLLRQIDRVAWDGRWYHRAYHDDGSLIGSADSEECRIDLIAQAWSVIAPPTVGSRARQAMNAALEYLVDEPARLIKLLAPPFDTSAQDPGYIKGYPPGIRENGAQYTHAATWAVWAMVRLGDADRAMALFRLLNPILRSKSREEAEHYRLEPYVLAGDIYSVGEHRGRGGWSWYTGAAAWLYRAGIEELLGMRRSGDELELLPCLPDEWPGFSARLQRGRAIYNIEVSRHPPLGRREAELVFDGNIVDGKRFPFIDDGETHSVVLRLPAAR